MEVPIIAIWLILVLKYDRSYYIMILKKSCVIGLDEAIMITMNLNKYWQ